MGRHRQRVEGPVQSPGHTDSDRRRGRDGDRREAGHDTDDDELATLGFPVGDLDVHAGAPTEVDVSGDAVGVGRRARRHGSPVAVDHHHPASGGRVRRQQRGVDRPAVVEPGDDGEADGVRFTIGLLGRFVTDGDPPEDRERHAEHDDRADGDRDHGEEQPAAHVTRSRTAGRPRAPS